MKKLYKTMNKKAGVSIPIFIMTILVLALVAFSIPYFLNRERNIRGIVDAPKIMDDFAVEDILLDYYFEGIFDRTVAGMNFEDGEEVFIKRYLEELNNYKDEDESYFIKGFDEVEKQAENVQFVDGRK